MQFIHHKGYDDEICQIRPRGRYIFPRGGYIFPRGRYIFPIGRYIFS